MTLESQVNVYGKQFPVVIKQASGSYLIDTDGNRYFDLFSSAGVSNFGHNNPILKSKLISYLEKDGLVHGLDYYTESKNKFIKLMETKILPKHVQGKYRYYFSPPAGTLAIEAAIKYARKYTGRRELMCFTNGFHGLTYNALSITGNASKRQASYCDLQSVTRLPYDGYYGEDVDLFPIYRKIFDDASSGFVSPAAAVFETIQAEGGCHTASAQWYKKFLELCKEFRIVSIVDEVQAGCGRTGEYFSFNHFDDMWPDMICLSKSLSGIGLPLSLVMLSSELDILDSGENSGTFRGNCLGVESAANTIELFVDDKFKQDLIVNQSNVFNFISNIQARFNLPVKGRGMLRGIDFPSAEIAARLIFALKEQRILVESCGGSKKTIKIMPPLNSCPETLEKVLNTVIDTCEALLK